MLTRLKITMSVIALLLLGTFMACNTEDNGMTGTAPNEAPTAEIIAPMDGATANAGQEVTFQGSADDPEEGTLTGSSLVWDSDLDGQIGTGATVTTNSLAAGDHTITLTATDSEGASGTESIAFTVQLQSDPTVEISSPSDGETFAQGNQISFLGSADDPQDGALTGGSLVWDSDLDDQIGTGETFTRTDLSVGEHTITLTATDSDGNSATATVSITVQSDVTAQITSPSDGATFIEGDPIPFQGSANDPEDGTLTGGSLVWDSDRDGQIGTGQSFSRNDLSVGTHRITLTATDSDSNVATASVSITVEEKDPSIQINTPSDNESFVEGDPIAFEGSGTDPQDGSLTGTSLVWTSDLDGQIGTGENFSRNDLSVGDHTITLTGTDSDGNTGTAMVSITVEDKDPSVQINSPSNGESFNAGSSITFAGSGNDPQDGSLTGTSLVWTSDLDGQIGTGENFSRNDLSVGDHTITLTGTDSDGNTATASVSISVVSSGGQGLAYVTNETSNDVSVVDVAAETVVGTISNLGAEPKGVAFTPDGSTAFVVNGPDAEAVVIDVATETVTTQFIVGTEPTDVAVSPDGGTAYTSNQGSDDVAVIDVATNSVSTSISVGDGPTSLAVSPDGSRVYVANINSGDVSVIDVATNTVTTTISAGTAPNAVAFAPDGSVAYVANRVSDDVSVIDVSTENVTSTISGLDDPNAVAFTPSGNTAYVVNSGSNNVAAIDVMTETITAFIPVGTAPIEVAVSPDGSTALVTNFLDDTVSVISVATNTVIASIPVGAAPSAVAFKP